MNNRNRNFTNSNNKVKAMNCNTGRPMHGRSMMNPGSGTGMHFDGGRRREMECMKEPECGRRREMECSGGPKGGE
jgi:hypothetical protein